eukprot:gnl/TRDRNA2_/TRDRNA2_44248_c0_seq2.p1 gnl/TRDRNA2_/TRDRNA2_44248_c0~~gnl/TRDRNA2_/TRDRNA2_44248_c0_seq2.p1  ORF type:complete len:300 (+),score=49.14 gnl/TRDRNA2_/TRDRNA2_44248_c0_seq2:83-901(+)
MSHIPKRATQHGLFNPGFEVPPTTLKPGQEQLMRQNLYTEAATPLQENYLIQGKFRDSVYFKTIANLMIPADYENPQKPMRPPPPAEAKDASTSHWCSEYRSMHTKDSIAGSEYQRQRGPMFRPEDPPAAMDPSGADTTYLEEFGKYGSNPRDLVKPTDTVLPMMRSKLMDGTTKRTKHVPGYQGYIAVSPGGSEQEAQERGSAERAADKTNVVQTFRRHVVGYSGHVPQDVRNDRGVRLPTTETVAGRDFVDPAVMTRSLQAAAAATPRAK